MKTNKIFAVILLLTITVCLYIALVPNVAFSRAGGGGGGGGGGIVLFILMPFLIIYSLILSYLVFKKNKNCNSLLQRLGEMDNSWDLDKIKAQIEMAFLKIQRAWMKRDQDIAKDYMSERLYEKHKFQTDQMIAEKRKNVLEMINLKEAKIVEVADFKDDSKDRIWVHIKGSMIDYTIDETSGDVISGDKDKIEDFTELWKFIKGPNDWVLDEIDQKVEISDLIGFRSFSEELR